MQNIDTSAVSSIRKTCRILASLTDPRVTRLTDIAEYTGLDMSTALRILKDLESENFVERDPVSKQYVLGPQVYAMHRAMVGGLDIQALTRPALIRLSRQFGDTVILSVPLSVESVCVDLCLGDYPIRANYLDVGSRRPLGVGAGSLALLAAFDPHEAQAIMPYVHQQLAKHYPAFTQGHLNRAVQQARQCGYAVLLDVVVDKMGGIGTVIRDPGGRPVAALSLAALTERITRRETELAQALAAEVREIERAWLPAN